MQLSSYKNLICNLPYLDQAFETRRTTWQREYERDPCFRSFCDRVFDGGSLVLSRRDLFLSAEREFQEGLFSIVLWGYPRNMRGNSFIKILSCVSTIEELLSVERHLSAYQFMDLYKQFNGTGMGLSTLSKVLYFFRFAIEGKNCLIMDKRIIDVINSKTFSELSAIGKITDFNKSHTYMIYLNEMEKIAQANRYKSDQLELFLFLFGKNLKAECCNPVRT